jgi:hypothetical protein
VEKPLTPTDKLDEVLRCLAQDRGNASLLDIVGLVKRITSQEYAADKMLQIIRKLVRDGYVDFEKVSIVPPFFSEQRYAISFDGEFFILEEGGYRQQQKNEIEDRRKIELENSKNQLNQTLLVIGAIGAAVGTVALVIWEIYKYFCLERHH